MKTSNIILLSTAGLIFLAMISLSFRMRSNLKNQNVNTISATYELSGFDQIRADGKMRLQIQHGSEYKIEFKANNKEFKENLELSTKGNLLSINLNKDYSIHERIEGTITLPQITVLKVNGKTRVNLKDFEVSNLQLQSNGKSHINLIDNQIDSLYVTCSEDGSIDYRSGEARFAHFEMSNITQSYFSGGTINMTEGQIKDSAHVNFRTKTQKLNLELLDEGTISKR